MNDQMESNENNVADECMDIAGAPPHTLHEECVNAQLATMSNGRYQARSHLEQSFW